MAKKKKTDNTMAKRKRQTIQWPKEKDRQYNGQKQKTDNTMAKRKRQTIQWPKRKRQTIQWPKEKEQTIQWPKEKEQTLIYNTLSKTLKIEHIATHGLRYNH